MMAQFVLCLNSLSVCRVIDFEDLKNASFNADKGITKFGQEHVTSFSGRISRYALDVQSSDPRMFV